MKLFIQNLQLKQYLNLELIKKVKHQNLLNSIFIFVLQVIKCMKIKHVINALNHVLIALNQGITPFITVKNVII